MKYILTSLACLLLITANSCKNKSTTASTASTSTTKIYAEVMEIHDEVMPLISKVHRQKRKINRLLKEVDKKYINVDNLKSEISILNMADQKMMDWMNEFDSSRKNNTSPESIAYYTKEKEKISLVSKIIHAAVKSSKKITDNVKIRENN